MLCRRCSEASATARPIVGTPMVGDAPSLLCHRCEGELAWDRCLHVLRQWVDRSPSEEDLAATAAALAGMSEHLQRSTHPVPPPQEISDFIQRYGRGVRRADAPTLSAAPPNSVSRHRSETPLPRA